MTRYQRVTEADRYQIQAYLKSQVSVGQMSGLLGFHKTTIYREIRRNGRRQEYQASYAQRLARRRFRHCRRTYKLEGSLKEQVLDKLQIQWSPEQIAVRFIKEKVPCVSFSTIYRFIRRNQYHEAYKTLLRSYNKRGAGRIRQRRRIQGLGLSISQRPTSANHRSRLGHWERDTMYIQDQKQVLVCTDRKSRFTVVEPLKKVDTTSVAQQTQAMLHRMPYQTMTNDNGPEFRSKNNIGVPVYFCEPRKPQQRGTIENTIGLLRQYIKRKTSMSELTHQRVQLIQNRINHRPRKCLDFNTPYEIFFKTKVALALTT